MSLPVRQSSRKTRGAKTEASVPRVKEEETKLEKRSEIKDAVAKMKALPPKKPAKAVDAKTQFKEEEETKPAPAPKPAPKAAAKTKKAKAGDETPLADRTDITTLKKAMYIGAHVSSAGGTYLHLSIGQDSHETTHETTHLTAQACRTRYQTRPASAATPLLSS